MYIDGERWREKGIDAENDRWTERERHTERE